MKKKKPTALDSRRAGIEEFTQRAISIGTAPFPVVYLMLLKPVSARFFLITDSVLLPLVRDLTRSWSGFKMVHPVIISKQLNGSLIFPSLARVILTLVRFTR